MTELNFVEDYQLRTLLSASASDLPDIWKNQFEGKRISFSGDGDSNSNEIFIATVVLSIEDYLPDGEKSSSFIDGIEIIVDNPSGVRVSNQIVKIVGTLRSHKKITKRSYEKIINGENIFYNSPAAILRIQVESISITLGPSTFVGTM